MVLARYISWLHRVRGWLEDGCMTEERLPPEILKELKRRMANVRPRPSPCEHTDGLHWSKYSGLFFVGLRDGRTFIPITFCPFCGVKLEAR